MPDIYYLSGPMRNDEDILQFHQISSILRLQGYTILSPAEAEEKDNVPNGWLKAGLNKLTLSDQMILFGDWRNARGCLLELAISTHCGIGLWTYGEDGQVIPYKIDGHIGSSDDTMSLVLMLLIKQNRKFKETVLV